MFGLDTFGWRTRFLAICCTIAFAGPLRADLMYGVSGAGGGASTLYTIDPTTGNVTSTIGGVTVSGIGVMVSSIAFDPNTAQLYGTAVDPVSGKGELLAINTGTATATPVGPFGLSPVNTNATSIAFSNTSALYGYFKTGAQPESLYSISGSTGNAALIGSSLIGSTSGDGMAMSPDGKLYFAGKGAAGSLYTLNTSTGQATVVATLSNAPLGSTSQIKGLAFNGAGTMYGIDLLGTTSSDLVTIDPSSGNILFVAATQPGVIAIAFAPPAAVPEPSSFVLMGGAVAAGWFFRRRARGQVGRS